MKKSTENWSRPRPGLGLKSSRAATELNDTHNHDALSQVHQLLSCILPDEWYIFQEDRDLCQAPDKKPSLRTKEISNALKEKQDYVVANS